MGSSDHQVYGFDASGHSVVWSAVTGGPVISSPAVANGRVYVGSDDGKLHVYALPS